MTKVIEGFQSDYRWTVEHNGKKLKPEVLSYQVPGCGFGGSCLPKDVEAITAMGVKNGLEMQMTKAIIKVNSKQPYQVEKLIEESYGSLKNKDILLLGLAFKPGTDDIRESASLKIIESLYKLDAKITVHDPIALNNYINYLGKDLPNIKNKKLERLS